MIESITMDEALNLFKLPKTVGEFETTEVKVNIGRFGPYILHDKKFISIPKEIDPLSISIEKAIELIVDKRQKDADKLIKTFTENPEATIENGRWGPFIRFGKLNVKIPKGKEIESITYDEVVAWAAEADKLPKKGGRKFTKKK
jgi:DNA topoisomerase-1